TPVGVFDLDQLAPPVVLRLAAADESLLPIGGGTPMDCVAGEIVYADAAGVFSRYARDADRTKITTDTTRVLLVVDGTPKFAHDELAAARDQFLSLLTDVVPEASVDACAAAEVQ